MRTHFLRRWPWIASMAMLSSARGALSAPVTVRHSFDTPGTLQVYQVIKTPGSGTWAAAFSDSTTKMYKGKVGHLATIRSGAENLAVSGAMRPVIEGGGMSWIGATDDPTFSGSPTGEGDWRWIGDNRNNGIPDSFWSGGANGNSVNGAYVSWDFGEPNNFFFGEHYADIAGPNTGIAGRWNDLSGGAGRGEYIVEYDAVPIADFGHQFTNGHRYEVIAGDLNGQLMTWHEARTEAFRLPVPTGFRQGDLAIVDSQELQDFLTNLVRTDAVSDQPGYHPWIGASDGGAEGVWRWVDNRQFWQGAANGTPVGSEYANWNAGEPNDFAGEDYAQLNPFDDDGEWNDLNGEARLASFIVEWKPINPTKLPGDYNRNGVVDAADYVLWRKTLNQIVANRADGADGNANGVIDVGDYEYWRARFGNVVPIPGRGADASAVPEPSAVVLMLFAFAIPSSSWRQIRPSEERGKCPSSQLGFPVAVGVATLIAIIKNYSNCTH